MIGIEFVDGFLTKTMRNSQLILNIGEDILVLDLVIEVLIEVVVIINQVILHLLLPVLSHVIIVASVLINAAQRRNATIDTF